MATRVVGAGVAEVALDVGETIGKAVEHVVVDGLTGVFDALARMLPEMIDGPVIHGHAEHRTVEQPAPLEAIERAKGHHLGEIPGDAEGDEYVGRLGCVRYHRLAFRLSVHDDCHVDLLAVARSECRTYPVSLGDPKLGVCSRSGITSIG